MEIGILIYPDVEELDFAGPFEVLSKANMYSDEKLNVRIISKSSKPVTCANGLIVTPHMTYGSCPQLDVLVVPGGKGSRKESRDEQTQDFIRSQFPKLRYLFSVCTGSLILAETGLLDGKRATTHHQALDELSKYDLDVKTGVKYVLDGNILSSAGISAGIDASLFLLEKLFDKTLAESVRERIEY